MTPPDDRVATPVALRVLRVVAALLGLAALIWIPVRSADVPGFSLANFFSYFTVLSNVLAVVVFVIGGVVDPRSETFDRLRGAATTYMVITGIVYAVLLSNVDVQIQDAWTNSVLHRIVPVLIVLDWILAPPRRRSAESGPVLWLVFPVVYGVYSLIRGPIVEWYPYPFLDPRERGYGPLAIGLAVLVVAFLLIALAVDRVGELAASRRSRKHATSGLG
ncbi:Pr6Pr family membrane protein [Rhodococcus sp. BP-316]|uniref:Pr6Pr family membrane protein n=1 Tax=unclassified Rhodococcus (in: high G+C Gram-positive bacteria) TaxID=192944 RepID=UPI001C9AF216|nr:MULTISPECIES: Pr6Pr family membrane protein [unclassified Rhodococcus (in: high G+C Gram-positive bacteria)]MBY6679793.1 Pr6Pr family membrane protein [Rhodococcus sp. BP-316]MBY6705550.1 Pr6Pr family membrane protein [Rhodococcus sp. BP-241]